jgi:formylmethanofuran dehydrogenase subunit C
MKLFPSRISNFILTTITQNCSVGKVFGAGSASIEGDVNLQDGQLMTAHELQVSGKSSRGTCYTSSQFKKAQ